MDFTEVEIPAFVHPHLFWIFEKSNSLKRLELETNLCSIYDRVKFYPKIFDLDEIVVVKCGKTWKRGKISHIVKEDDVSLYHVWLFDYAEMHQTAVLFNLNQNLKELPPFTKQSSLYQVVFTNETLNLEQSSRDTKCTTVPTVGAIETCFQLIKNSTLFFSTKKVIDNVCYGDILVKNKKEMFSLTKALIKEQLLQENTEMFFDVIEQRNIDKNSYFYKLRSPGKKKDVKRVEADNILLKYNVLTRPSRRESSGAESGTEGFHSENECAKTEKTRALLKLIERKRRTSSVFHSSSAITHDECDDFKEIKSPHESEDMNSSREDKSPKSINDCLLKSKPKLFKDDGLVTFAPAGCTKLIKREPKKKCLRLNYMSDSSIYSEKSQKVRTSSSNSTTKHLNPSKTISKEIISTDSKTEGDVSEANLPPKLKVKPTCSCKDCEFWVNNEGWGDHSEKFSDEIKDQSKILRPQSILLAKLRDEPMKIIEVSFKGMSKSEKQACFKILVHCSLSIQPILKVPDAPLNSSLHKAFKRLDYTKTKKIQAYVWPAICRSMNVCFVNKKHSGKTLAYLAPLCSFLLDREERYKELRRGGPIAVILASTSKQCEKVFDLANKLLEGTIGRPRVILATYPFDHVNMSNVDILISLPSVLIELLKKNATNLKRMCHLVIDNMDVIAKNQHEELDKIILLSENMLKNRTCLINVQVIMTGEHWTLQMENFCKRLRSMPLICIADYLEAAVYGKTDLNVKILREDAKPHMTANILENKWKYNRCVVVCNSDEEIEAIKNVFALNSISNIAIQSHMSNEEIHHLEINWEQSKSGENRVLISTDQIFHTVLSITSATLLVHYSLPEKWSMLTKRFYYLLENYKSPMAFNKMKMTSEMYILIDEKCEEQIPRIITLLKKFNGISNTQLNQLYLQHQQNQEDLKIENNIEICNDLKKFGYCTQEQCKERHKFCQTDNTQSILPKSGKIKFTITKIEDVCTYIVRLINNDEKTIIDNKFNSEMLNHLMNENRQPVKELIEHKKCVYWDCEDFDPIYRMCTINKVDDLIEIRVEGKTIRVSPSSLFEIPEDEDIFRDVNDNIEAELILSNFKPPYEDKTYSGRAYSKLKYLFEDKIDASIFSADVRLQIGNTIWVTDAVEEVCIDNMTLYKDTLSKILKNLKIVEANQDHLRNLYSLCSDAKIDLPMLTSPIKKVVEWEEKQVEPQWAFLDAGMIFEVFFVSAVSPDEFYVRLKKFNPLLDRLEEEIKLNVKKQGSKKNFQIKPEKMYALKNLEDNSYSRAIVKKIENDEILCFCVDYGDEIKTNTKNLYYLPNEFIVKLPCQAILCRLYGLKPIKEDWDEEATDILYDNAFEPNNDNFKTLYTKCMYFNKDVEMERNVHSILLKDVYSTQILVNQLLIDSGFAISRCGNIEDFEIPFEENYSEEEEDKDLKEVKDIIEKTQIVSSNNVKIDRPKNAVMLPNSNKNDSNEVLEFTVFGMGQFLEELMHSKNDDKKDTKAKNVSSDLPAITAAPPVDYRTPEVYWSQTNETIKLRIMLANAVNYSLKVERGRWFSFKCEIGENVYKVQLIFYEAVKKEISHQVCGMEVRAVLTKSNPSKWCRLTLHAKKFRNLHYELSKEELEDEPQRKFLDLGDISDCENDSSDGENKCLYWDISDMDSEFDKEFSENSS